MREKFFDIRSIHFRQFQVTLVFVAEKPPPPPMRENFWHQLYPFQAISDNFGFCGRKAPPWGKFFDTRSIHFRQFWATLVFVAEKPPPPMRENFWHQLYPFQAISDNFGFCGRKSPHEEKFFDTRSIHFRQFQATLVFVAEKSPSPNEGKFLTPDLSISGNFKQLWFLWQKSPSPNEGKFFDTRSIHFRQFQATLVFVAEKPPLQDEGKFFDTRSIHFRQFQVTLVFVAEKPLSQWGKIFWHQIYPFQAILSNFGFCGRRAPLPQDEGKFFDIRSIHFRQFWATLVFVAEKPPMRKNFLTPDLSISGNFEQLWFLWQKSPPPGWGKILWHQIYRFQAISSNFGFCGRKAPPPMRENFLTPDLSISGNFEQLWFLWQKSPCPPGWGKNFWHQIYPFQAILSNFGFCGRKAPPRDEGKFLTPDLSISGNFKQLWFLWQKSPPPPRMREIFWHQIYPFQAISGNFGFCGRKAPPSKDEGKFFDTRSIHFRQFWATLVFVAEKPPLGWGKFYWHQIYPSQAFWATLVFVAEKSPLQDEGKFLTPDLSISGNFKQLWFSWQKSPPSKDEGKFLTPDLSISGNFERLWFLWQKSPPPPGMREIFWHQIYPSQAILSNFGFCGRKAPPPPKDEGNFLTPDLSISGNFEQLWFLWQKSPPPDEENFLTPALSISGNFRQLWFLWQKSPPPPPWGKKFWHQIYPFQAILSDFGFCGRKAPPPSRMRENSLTPDLSISGNLKQPWFFVAEKPLPPQGKFFDTRSIHFRQFWATLVFVAVEPLPQWGWGKIFWHQIYPFQAILSDFGFCGRKAPPPMREIFLTPDLSISGNFEKLWFWWQKSPPPQMRGKNFDTRSIHFRQF